jgi:hypothetical protein
MLQTLPNRNTQQQKGSGRVLSQKLDKRRPDFIVYPVPRT